MYRDTFTSPYQQYADRVGQRFTVLRVIDTPDEGFDEECLPMYRIVFEDGYATDAWPEEVLLYHSGNVIPDTIAKATGGEG